MGSLLNYLSIMNSCATHMMLGVVISPGRNSSSFRISHRLTLPQRVLICIRCNPIANDCILDELTGWIISKIFDLLGHVYALSNDS